MRSEPVRYLGKSAQAERTARAKAPGLPSAQGEEPEMRSQGSDHMAPGGPRKGFGFCVQSKWKTLSGL